MCRQLNLKAEKAIYLLILQNVTFPAKQRGLLVRKMGKYVVFFQHPYVTIWRPVLLFKPWLIPESHNQKGQARPTTGWQHTMSTG
jgi:hypothetical protein